MSYRRFAGKSDKDYWNARNYGPKKLISRDCKYVEKRSAEFLAKLEEKAKKQERMKAFRDVFEGEFKGRFPKVFEEISSELIQEWDRVDNNKEFVFANIQIQQRLIINNYTEALAVWNCLFQELKNKLAH